MKGKERCADETIICTGFLCRENAAPKAGKVFFRQLEAATQIGKNSGWKAAALVMAAMKISEKAGPLTSLSSGAYNVSEEEHEMYGLLRGVYELAVDHHQNTGRDHYRWIHLAARLSGQRH